MKKIILIFALILSAFNIYANYTHAESVFDDYNQSTDSNFAYKNSSFRKDAKVEMYGDKFDISKGSDYNCEYTVAGQVRCWKYKIRQAEDTNRGVSEKILKNYNGLKQMKDVSSGDDFNCALDNANEAYCWGSNRRGQLGSETKSKNVKKPLKVASDVKFSKIYTKAHYTCGIDLDGHAYCWGDGSNGEVGNGKKGKFDTPQKVKTDVLFSRLSMAKTYVCGVSKPDSDIYCWGKGTKGKTSTANLDSSVPVQI
ncbi:regulator [Francisella sp. Scap27]|uniref:RCC1 domain-containing protein n=1 Tax=Francisella sp. Scap27 TaxID=2589986 RepID=UPI0015BACE43|nr:regulator [Francisella sp. Scap27]QLE79292.1 regulator [Francisella sp. Scap27]